MAEIISSFFGMIWALLGVILQLAGPVIILIFVCLGITKLAQPFIRNYINYITGVNPKAEQREINRYRWTSTGKLETREKYRQHHKNH